MSAEHEKRLGRIMIPREDIRVLADDINALSAAAIPFLLACVGVDYEIPKGVAKGFMMKWLGEQNKHDEKYADKCDKLRENASRGYRKLAEMTDDELKQAAKFAGVPVSYVQKFKHEIASNGGGYISPKGGFVEVNARNAQAVMRSFYEHDEDVCR